MNKELETIQSALNKLDLLIDDDKRCECINDKAQEYIGIIQNEIDKLSKIIKRKEKLEKVWKILKDKNVKMSLLKLTFKFENCIGYSCYLKVWRMNSLIAFDDSKYISQEEYNLLKEMLEEK